MKIGEILVMPDLKLTGEQIDNLNLELKKSINMENDDLLVCKDSDGRKIAFKLVHFDVNTKLVINEEFVSTKNAAFICASILCNLYPSCSFEFSALLQRLQSLSIENMCLRSDLKKLQQENKVPF